MEQKLTKSALFSFCEIPFRVASYKWRINNITSFVMNLEPTRATLYFEKMRTLTIMKNNLSHLLKIIKKQYGQLTEVEKLFFELRYYKHYERALIRAEMGLSEREYRKFETRIVKLFTKAFIENGLNQKAFLDAFDDEPLIIRNYERLNKLCEDNDD